MESAVFIQVSRSEWVCMDHVTIINDVPNGFVLRIVDGSTLTVTSGAGKRAISEWIRGNSNQRTGTR